MSICKHIKLIKVSVKYYFMKNNQQQTFETVKSCRLSKPPARVKPHGDPPFK